MWVYSFFGIWYLQNASIPGNPQNYIYWCKIWLKVVVYFLNVSAPLQIKHTAEVYQAGQFLHGGQIMTREKWEGWLWWWSTFLQKRTAFFWVITQGVVVISYRCFGTTYWSHLQGSRIHTGFLLDSWTLKMGPIGCPETSVGSYLCCVHTNPEERSCYLLDGGSVKSHSIFTVLSNKISHVAEIMKCFYCM